MCQTKAYTGRPLTQDCKKRSVIYETRCITCEENVIKEIEETYKDEENEKIMKDEIRNIKLYK